MENTNAQAAPVTMDVFEDGLAKSSPMPLSSKRVKSSYDLFLDLGNRLSKSLQDGTSPLLPNKQGFVDLNAAYNINKNTKLEGLAQIMLLERQAELKSPSSGFVTWETIHKAQEAGVECKITKGSKGLVIPVVDEKNWGEIKFQNTWFNVSQIENADALIAYCKEQMTEQYKKDVAYINEKYPGSTYKEKKNPADYVMEKPNEKAMPLNEKTEEPYQYIAQVLNAVQTNRRLYVTPEQAKDFQEKAVQQLSAEYEAGKKDVLAVKKMMNAAEHLYLNNRKRMQSYLQDRQNAPEQKIEAEQKKAPVHKKEFKREPEHSLGR